MNYWIISGHIGQDAKVHTFQNSSDEYISFSVAVKQTKNETKWVDCEYRKSAFNEKLLPYLLKGTKVTVMGKEDSRSHDNKLYQTIWVDKLEINTKTDKTEEAPKAEETDKDLPF